MPVSQKNQIVYQQKLSEIVNHCDLNGLVVDASIIFKSQLILVSSWN